MAPKKQKTSENMPDIRSFFGKENDVPGSPCKTPRKKSKSGEKSQTPTQTPIRVKNENGSDSVVTHSHRFTVKFTPTERKEYTIDCDQPRTIMDAIRSNLGTTEKMIKCLDESIIIQLGKKDRESVVPTHFPCSCIGDGETVILRHYNSEKIEKVQEQHDKTIHPKDNYSVFYIDTIEGLKTRTKLFRNKILKEFKFLCVYGEKGMTVEEALKQDGRFLDSLGEFKLSDNENPDLLTVRTQRVDSLDHKAFKIRLPVNKRESVENPTTSILDVARVSGRSVRKAMEQPDNSGYSTEEIYERLRQQFPELIEWMESRFPGDSYEKALNRGSEKFGKIQQAFSEVHRIQKLIKMGKSVCKILVSNVSQGTGFVLFDRFILTSAHLFKGCVQGKNLLDHIDVYALFDYDEPEPETNHFYFSAEKTLIDFDEELDFAVLQLNPDGKKPKSRAVNVKVPPGLLDRFGPVPESGEACLIGHPAGSVKKIDPTCIIEPEKRKQAVEDHLAKYKDQKVIVKKINEELKNQGIDDIMMGGEKAENVASYNTFMYHGASGSPVFDAHGQMFGIHTAGYTYELLNIKNNVIEYAHPLLIIFEKFVINLKDRGNDQVLEKVKEAVKKNEYLKRILQVEPMEVDQAK